MSSALKKTICRARLASRVRYKLKQRRNTRPRLSIFCSNGHIYAQIIDDARAVTLVSASTRSPELKTLAKKSNVESAVKVGELIAKKAQAAGITEVVFDRGSTFLYLSVSSME